MKTICMSRFQFQKLCCHNMSTIGGFNLNVQNVHMVFHIRQKNVESSVDIVYVLGINVESEENMENLHL
jgi:hypothetical protein